MQVQTTTSTLIAGSECTFFICERLLINAYVFFFYLCHIHIEIKINFSYNLVMKNNSFIYKI